MVCHLRDIVDDNDINSSSIFSTVENIHRIFQYDQELFIKIKKKEWQSENETNFSYIEQDMNYNIC